MEFIIKNVHLLSGEELVVKHNHSIWIKDKKIYKILSKDQIPNNIFQIDGGGHYLSPGLIDLHIHLMWDGSSDPVEAMKEGYEQMIIRSVANCQIYIENGITTVRDVGSVDDVSLHIAKGIRRGLIKGPNIITSGKTITITGGHDPFWARFVDGKEEAIKGVREQIFKGAEVIKISSTGGVYGREEGEDVSNSELNLEEQTAICEEAHKFGCKVAAHAIGREGILTSILAGVDTIEHGHYLDEELLKLMEINNVAWIPTLYVYKQISQQNEIPKYAKDKAVKISEIHVDAFKRFFHKNIIIGAGSDAGSPCTPHPTLIEELYQMYKLVPNPVGILKTATVNAGKIIGRQIGKIEEGYYADFILLEANPLDDLNNLRGIRKVFKNGELLSENNGI